MKRYNLDKWKYFEYDKGFLQFQTITTGNVRKRRFRRIT